jgi:DNA-binding transcriptional ArsR family regulator
MVYQKALAALADPTRRAIYEAVRGRARSVGDVAAGFPVSRPAVSQHLRVLREAGLVTETRQGTRHLFAANPLAARCLRDYFESVWTEAAKAFADHVHAEEERRHAKPRRR